MDAFQKALEKLNELLNENGVIVKGSRYQSPDKLGIVITIDGLDFSEHDKEVAKEIENLKVILDTQNKYIIELENEIKHKQDKINLLKAYNLTTHNELPHEPISVAQMLITATDKYPDADETYSIYDVSDLRQIAEHLLVYCNNNKNGE